MLFLARGGRNAGNHLSISRDRVLLHDLQKKIQAGPLALFFLRIKCVIMISLHAASLAECKELQSAQAVWRYGGTARQGETWRLVAACTGRNNGPGKKR
jgi:hypothetical protein